MKTWEEVLKDVRLRVNLMEDQEIQNKFLEKYKVV